MSGAAVLALLLAAAGPVRFEESAQQRGLGWSTTSGGGADAYIIASSGHGLAFLDYDGDGRLDLLAANGGTLEQLIAGAPLPGARLFRNLGDGRFADRTSEAGLDAPGWAGGVAVGDYDNDGWPDVLVAAYGRSFLYHNCGDGRFEEVAESAGVAGDGYPTGAAFADIDRDGWLDLYVARYVAFDHRRPPPHPCRWKELEVYCGPMGLPGAADLIYHNDGHGGFRLEPTRLGAGLPSSYGFMPLFLDYDGDGDGDLIVANDTEANFLLRNDGDGHFEELGMIAGVAYSAEGRAQASMGIDSADIDGDGWPEVFVSNFSHDSNTLYAYRGDEFFDDVTAAAGLAAPGLLTLGWAAVFLDYDNDGELDLVLANGHVYPQVDAAGLGTSYRQPLHMYRNDGSGYFQEVGAELGPDFVTPLAARSIAAADFDDDGDLDLAVSQLDGPLRLLVNLGGNRRSWVKLRLEGQGCNRDGIGALVSLQSGDGVQQREHRLSAGYLGSHDPRLHFGLDGAELVDEVLVRWPCGLVEAWDRLAARREHRLVEGRGRRVRPPRPGSLPAAR